MTFIEAQDERYAPLWKTIRTHRFLVSTRDGTLPDEVFATWMRQDSLFVEAAIPFRHGPVWTMTGPRRRRVRPGIPTPPPAPTLPGPTW